MDHEANPRDNIVFVLDRPKEPANVGAVVRLLGNFGLSRLRLVGSAPFDPDSVLRFARRGERVAERVERHSTLEAALADCSLIFGTTRRERALDRPVLTPRQAAVGMVAVSCAAGVTDAAPNSPAGAAAVLFGPEDFGLSNEALDRCHAIITIPTVPEDASLNLAQSAVIIAYELFLALAPNADDPSLPTGLAERSAVRDLAVAGEMDRVFEALRHLLSALHDAPIEGRTRSTLSRMRALLLRAAPGAEEAGLLVTLFEHAARDLQRGRNGAD